MKPREFCPNFQDCIPECHTLHPQPSKRAGWRRAARQGGACLAEHFWESHWLALSEYLGKRALEAPAFFHCLEVSLREAAPRQLLLSAAAWQDATRPRF